MTILCNQEKFKKASKTLERQLQDYNNEIDSRNNNNNFPVASKFEQRIDKIYATERNEDYDLEEFDADFVIKRKILRAFLITELTNSNQTINYNQQI